MDAESVMLKARAQLLLEHPFFGVLALKLKFVVDESISTANTDGTRLSFAPKFVNKQTMPQSKGLIAHEIMHIVLNHHTRRGDRDPDLWNIGGDFGINNELIKAGFILPDGALIDKSYDGMSTEAIYAALEALPKAPKPCPWGIVLDGDSGSLNPKSFAQQESEWQIAVGQAAEAAKAAGKLPGNIELLIKDIVSPLVDWRTVLWPFMTSLINDDFNWNKPNRAYIGEDEYLPSMRSQGCGAIAICFDTSGSTRRYHEQFIGELNCVLNELQPEKVIVVQTDHKVQSVTILEQGETLEDVVVNIHGHGGTAFEPSFKYLFDNHPDLEAVVYLTDLESSAADFANSQAYSTTPVLWVSTNTNTEAPFGQTVYMKD